MAYQPRTLEKFEDVAGSVSQLMPDAEFEWSTRQALQNPFATISGANYGYRHQGTAPAVKAFAYESVTCSILATPGQTPADVDTAYDALKQKLWSIGRGKIFTIDSAGTRRWAYASLQAMPEMRWRAGDIFEIALVISFVRESDWYSTTLTTGSGTMGGAVVIANPGNAPVWNAIITIGGTYTNPVVTNNTAVIYNTAAQKYILQTNRDGTNANHRVKFDAGEDSVEYAPDAVTYADDYANFVRNQVHQMRLDPGNNSFTGTGVSASTTLYWSFYAAYH